MTIRPATEADYPAIHTLLKEFSVFIKTPEKMKVTVEQMTAASGLFNCIVAVDDSGAIVGYSTYFFGFYSWTGKSLYLDDLYVIEACRGQKVGSQLINYIFDIARKADCKKVRWQVSNWNKPAQAFYTKCGAVIDDVEINCDLML